LIVIARLVRATYEHDRREKAGGGAAANPSAAAFMGGPDEPGHDETL